MHIPVTGFAAAICGLLLVFLALRVSQLRVRHKVTLGNGGLPQLARAIRAHANTVEQAPIFLLMSACYEIYLGAGPLLIIVVATFLLARVIFALGLSHSELSPARRLGASLTYLSQFVLGLALLTQVVSTLF